MLGGVRRKPIGKRPDEHADEEPDKTCGDVHEARFPGRAALPAPISPPSSLERGRVSLERR
jgi:hypothetical protein